MRRATEVKSVKSLAKIAAHEIIKTRGWPHDNGLSRNFDDCFEHGEGDEVLYQLLILADGDDELRSAMTRNGLENWLDGSFRANLESRRFCKREPLFQ